MKKTRATHILVLTPVHPMQIAEMINFFSQYETITANSIQAFALLAEETLQQKYLVNLFAMAKALKAKPEIFTKTKDLAPVIVYGNLDKNTNIPFDYKVSIKTHEDGLEEFDTYLNNAMQLIQTEVDWYKKDDCELELPSLHHLAVFLKTLGIVPSTEEKDGI